MRALITISIAFIILMVILCIYVFIPDESKEQYVVMVIILLTGILSIAITDKVINRIKNL